MTATPPTITKLPPDPEDMNNARAEWAGVALEAFMRHTVTEADHAVYDLICDLHHWCDRNGQDFRSAVARAQTYYDQETMENPDA